MAAMKMGGHDASKMSAQDKSDMFDKMSEDKRMKLMMGHGGMMHKGGKMDKMHKMEKPKP